MEAQNCKKKRSGFIVQNDNFRCFRFETTPMAFDKAEIACEMSFYELISINNAFENAYVACNTFFFFTTSVSSNLLNFSTCTAVLGLL